MVLTVEEIVSPCYYSFLLFLPFPMATLWTPFSAEVSCTQLRFVYYRYSLASSLLKNVQEYLTSFTFSEFLRQFLSKKSSTSCAKVHNSLFYSVLKAVWFNKSHTELTAFLWVLSQMIHRKNLLEQSTCWTAQSGRFFFLGWLLHLRISAVNCNCVMNCMH